MNAAALAPVKLYPIRKPVAALVAGAAVALLGGLIGLGGAEFRLPLLIMVFALFAHRAVRINLLISLATLATSAVARWRYVPDTSIPEYLPEILAMSAAGLLAGWVGAGRLASIPKASITPLISILLALISALLVLEALHVLDTLPALPPIPSLRLAAALAAGLLIGTISSLLGVAGGEFIIPVLIFAFGADVKTAGSASVLISTPIVLAGITRHWLNGHFRSRSLLAYLVLPMSVGSVLGALGGSYLSAWIPAAGLKAALALILALSAFKLWRQSAKHTDKSRTYSS